MPENETTENAMLARIDERTSTLVRDIEEIKEALNAKYVTHAEFDPVKKLVYGMVGLVMVAVVGALISLVVKGH